MMKNPHRKTSMHMMHCHFSLYLQIFEPMHPVFFSGGECALLIDSIRQFRSNFAESVASLDAQGETLLSSFGTCGRQNDPQ